MGGKSKLYDSTEMVLTEIKTVVNPKRDLEHVFYDDGNEMIKVLNKVSNIYTLKYNGNIRYFKTHAFLLKYLKERLSEEATVIEKGQ